MEHKQYGVSHVRASFPARKQHDELYGEWAVSLLYRPLSFVVTPPLLRLGMPATAITFAGLILTLCLPLLALSGSHAYLWVGLAAISFSILDCVDGNIARTTDSVSRLGHYADFLTDIIHRATLYLAIGLLAPMPLQAPLWLLGAALLAILARLCRVYLDHRFPAADVNTERGLHPPYLVAFISGLDGLTPLLLIITGWLGGVEWLVYWLCFYSLLDFAHTQFNAMARLR